MRYDANVIFRNMHLCYLNISCKNLSFAKYKLTRLYGFQEYGAFYTGSYFDGKIVLKQNDIFIMLTENVSLSVDTIDDIAFSVESINEYCERVKTQGGRILQQSCVLNCCGNVIDYCNSYINHCDCTDTNNCCNFVQVAVIKSPVGNVQHTLLNTQSFQGDFLPGFIRNVNIVLRSSTLLHIDHVAFAAMKGDSIKYTNWYKTCFKLLPFKISPKETSNGLIICARNNNGIKLLTLIEHPCSENGVTSKNDQLEVHGHKVKFVFGESLLDEGVDQIQAFLQSHGEAGVQHIAFLSSDILYDAHQWVTNGADFIKPPIGYYKEIESTLDRLRTKVQLDDVYSNGILIDAEKQNGEEGYLYQVFTKAILNSNCFFFELIQRDNAKGFGQGNIAALWRALDAHTHQLSDNGKSKY